MCVCGSDDNYTHIILYNANTTTTTNTTTITTGDCICTGGDDRWICMWSLENNSLLSRTRMQAPIRAVDFAVDNGKCC